MSFLSTLFKGPKGDSWGSTVAAPREDWLLKAEEYPRDALIRHRAAEECARLGRPAEAMKHVLEAADLYLSGGAAVKSLAVLGLGLRIEPENDEVRTRIANIARDEEITPGQRGDITVRTRLRAWTPLFSEFSRADLTEIVGQMTVRRFEQDEVLMREGEVLDELSVLMEGNVWISTRNTQGEPIEIGRLRPGDFFGEASVLGDLPAPATLIAASAGELLTWPRTSVDAISASRPGLRHVLGRFHEARSQKAVEAVVAKFRQNG